jgi:hypothetical protein
MFESQYRRKIQLLHFSFLKTFIKLRYLESTYFSTFYALELAGTILRSKIKTFGDIDRTINVLSIFRPELV